MNVTTEIKVAQLYAPAVNITKSFEGICDGDPSTVNLDPYMCPAGYWTIGWGHVVRDARGVMLKGKANKNKAYAIYPHGITMHEAETLLYDDIRSIIPETMALITVPLSINQQCAILDFVFNKGINAFKYSTLIKCINAKDNDGVLFQLKRWNKYRDKNGVLKVSRGLTRRCEAECTLWSTVN